VARTVTVKKIVARDANLLNIEPPEEFLSNMHLLGLTILTKYISLPR
jgi:hypothetical protein